MATIDLMMLEQRLLRGENPLPILTDLLEHFGPKSFARLGDRASDHPMLAYLICDALRDVFGFEPCMHGAAFVRADDFVRGVFFVEDRFGTVFYFERGSIGVMSVADPEMREPTSVVRIQAIRRMLPLDLSRMGHDC